MPLIEGVSISENSIEGSAIRVTPLSEAVNHAQCWDRFVRSHPQGTVFHLLAWSRVVASAFGHEPCHLIALDVGSGEVVGILPLFFVRSRLFGKMLISTPQAAYGGVLARSNEAAVLLLHNAAGLARQKRVRFLELRHFQNALAEPSLATKDLYVTFRQELWDGPEKIYQAIPRKTRAEIREGIRNDLEFRVDAIGVDEFHGVYSRSVRELGTPVFSKKLFSSGLREFGADCKIFSVHWKGKLVAGVWTLFYQGEVIPYYGGSIKEYNRLAVNNFMYWMLIKYGCENGYRLFDFGRSKKGSGSFNFKKRWGMVMTDLPYQYVLVESQCMPDTSPLNPKFTLGIQIWRRLPLLVTNTVGPLISKHLI